MFWSVTLYDVDTRSLIVNEQKIADRSSRMDLKKNTDGSVDIYCGPTALAGFESRWSTLTLPPFRDTITLVFPEPILNLDWRYADPNEPTAEELAKEINGYATEDITDPNDPTKVILAKGKQVVSFAVLRDDGKTASGCWRT